MNHKHIPGDDSLKKQKLLNVIAYDSVLSHVVSTITKILTKKTWCFLSIVQLLYEINI
jgi:hypothetical protein